MTKKDNVDDADKLQAELAKAQEQVAKLQAELSQSGPSSKNTKAKVTGSQPSVPGGKVIEGRFDGQNMIGPEGKVYPVPANYASKSKLVEGDTLKLTIAPDGSFIYKQIGPVERKKLIGTLGFEGGQYTAIAGDNHYRVLYASVTYFKAQPGDEVTVVIPAHGQVNWAAIEAII